MGELIMATIGTTDGTGGGWVTGSGVNNGASVAQAGNADTTTGPITNSVTLISMADDFGESVGSKVVINTGYADDATKDNVGIDHAIASSGGTFAHSASATQWVIRGGGATTTLAGAAYAGFATPGADYNGATKDGIHQLVTTRRLGTQSFNMYAVPSTQITPNFTKSGADGDAQNYVKADDGSTAATDDAATPSRSVPGELTYHYGGLAAPTTDEYKAKDVFES
jgi:hypothetical protein